jgi:hypothetical protein
MPTCSVDPINGNYPLSRVDCAAFLYSMLLHPTCIYCRAYLLITPVAHCTLLLLLLKCACWLLIQLNHLYTAVAERHDVVINFADAGLPPKKNATDWAYVYLVSHSIATYNIYI